MKASVILALSFLALAAGGCAWMGANGAGKGGAAIDSPPATPATVSFTQADLDGDARVTPREFDLWVAGNTRGHDAFYAADTNLDGVLTLDEWQTMVNRPSAAAGASVVAGRGVRP